MKFIKKIISKKNFKNLILLIFIKLLLVLYAHSLSSYCFNDNYIPKDLYSYSSEEDKLYNFRHLKKKPNNSNNCLIMKEKKELLNYISKFFNRKNISTKVIYLKGYPKFGNNLINLNNAIFFCEILGCNKIILLNYNFFFIKNRVLNYKYNMTIEPNLLNKNLSKKYLILPPAFFFFYYKYIKPENRFYLIKEEILNNIPKIQTNQNDLYIHIRSGDIFNGPKKNAYSQPPLCFYKKVLEKFKFRKIFIISEDKSNPIINFLLKEFNYIHYKKNKPNYDISYIANAYNIIASVSSFFVTIIKLNDKLRIIWEYDIYRLSEKFLHLHYSVYDFPHKYKIYKMNPSKYYKKMMYPWYNSPEQRKIMIEEKCKSKFLIIRPTL